MFNLHRNSVAIIHLNLPAHCDDHPLTYRSSVQRSSIQLTTLNLAHQHMMSPTRISRKLIDAIRLSLRKRDVTLSATKEKIQYSRAYRRFNESQYRSLIERSLKQLTHTLTYTQCTVHTTSVFGMTTSRSSKFKNNAAIKHTQRHT